MSRTLQSRLGYLGGILALFLLGAAVAQDRTSGRSEATPGTMVAREDPEADLNGFGLDEGPASETSGTSPARNAAPEPGVAAAGSSSSDTSQPAADTVPVTIFLLVQVTTDVPQEQLRDTFEEAREVTACEFQSIEVRPISPSLYAEFGSLTSDFASAPNVVHEGKITIRQLQARGSLWELRLENGVKVLQKLEVEYRKAGKEEYVPQGPREASTASLVLIVPGSYALRLPKDDTPVGLKAEVADLESGETETIEQEWPTQSSQCYLITLRNFQGNRQELFEAIKEKPEKEDTIVSNPLSDVQMGQDLVFVFASLGSKLPPPGEIIDENRYVPNIAGLPRRNVKRVWMRFPLTEEKLASEVEQDRRLTGKDLCQQIRSSTPSYAEESVTISADSQPRWIELPPSGTRFSRDIILDDMRKLHEAFPRVWRLVVWEFQSTDDATPRAIAVEHPDGIGQVYVVDEEIEAWPKVIERAASSAAEKSVPPPAEKSGDD